MLEDFAKKHRALLKKKPGGKPIRVLLDNDRVFENELFVERADELIPGGLVPLPKRSPDLMCCDYWLHHQIKKELR